MHRDRLPPIDLVALDDAQRQAVDEFHSARGEPVLGPFVPLLRSPELMRRARALGDYLRYRSRLAPRLRELLILMTAREWTQQTEWSIHDDAARRAGLRAETIDAVAAGRRPDALAEDEAALHDLFVELQRHRCVSDASYARAVELLGEQGVLDAIGIIGYYTLLAMVMNVARTPPPEGAAAALTSFPF